MSTGISISSINRIKELAEEKKYKEALEILDTQNLDKSINPQFLRISGEIFRENKRYYDCRRILLKSHQMSPQGIRIIYELIQLYLELGYYTKAQKYYEQYLFYSTPEDTQKDYVEYVMKKAAGADVKELASILIPILERMPEDKWNFEAILLYDKLGRKDKALEESQYILEHFKDSIYVKPVIEYIDEKLDVDQYFYIYPKEEVTEDTELFGDLIAEEDKILEADYLRMYPPEARIMVEAEDKDAIDVKLTKEKKVRKKKKKKKQSREEEQLPDDKTEEQVFVSQKEEMPDIVKEALEVSSQMGIEGQPVLDDEEVEKKAQKQSEEEQVKKDREAALEQLLSKKIDKEAIRESAKQVAKAVKDIDTSKAKNQVISVAESVKDNVKKATDAIEEAVGVKSVAGESEDSDGIKNESSDDIVDGIIESILEPPKKVIGQVVMNEELDALIPDSLEAMSAEEVADIEAKKEEAERLELEALEASMRLEEEKKKARSRKHGDEERDDIEEATKTDSVEEVIVQENLVSEAIATVSYEELKARFLAERSSAEEEPLESLGFISVVQSDVDSKLEDDLPDAAGILHQMIDNKEFYSGEDSTGFESKASYENHGFEIEDYDFEDYVEEDIEEQSSEGNRQEDILETLTVEDIYAEETVVDFDEIVPEKEFAENPVDDEPVIETAESEEAAYEEPVEVPEKEPVIEAAEVEEPVYEEPAVIPDESSIIEVAESEETAYEEPVYEEPVEVPEEEPVIETAESEEAAYEEPVEVPEEEPVIETAEVEETAYEEPVEVLEEEPVMETAEAEESVYEEPVTDYRKDRAALRVRIILSDSMVRKLLDLKESR
ncbi:MAG: hypothetical protein ACI4A3_00960 [Lachnospiraceae bacterium]